jgi:transposase
LERALREGPEAHGFGTLLWTTLRLAAVIERQTAVRYHPDHVWRLMQTLGWSFQRPAGQTRERGNLRIARWREVRLAKPKKPSRKSVDSLR